MSERDTVYFKRQFLNPDEGVALVQAKVTQALVTGRDDDQQYVNFDAEFTVGDCNRQITLDFSVYGSHEGKVLDEVNNLRIKLRRLRQTFAAFDRALTEQLDEIEARIG